MSVPFDPYVKWLGIRDPERPPNHYLLLGLTLFEGDAEVIEAAADRQMSHVRTYQTGAQSEVSQRVLNELAAARLCLLTKDKKVAYDAQLRALLAPKNPAAPGGKLPDGGTPAAPAVPAKLRTRAATLPVPQPLPTAQPLPIEPLPPPPRGVAAAKLKAKSSKSATQQPALRGALAVGGLLLAGVVAFILTRGSGAPQPDTSVATSPSPTASQNSNSPLPATVKTSDPAPRQPSSPRQPEMLKSIAPEATVPLTVEPTDDQAPEEMVEDDGSVASAATADRPVIQNKSNGDLGSTGVLPEPKVSTEPEMKPLRVAAPEEPERQRAIREMRELYSQQLRTLRNPADKSKLAATLLGGGRKSHDDPAMRFVLLSEAARLAGDAGDIKLAFEAADEIGQGFTADLWSLRIEALRVGARNATTKEQQAAFAQAASDVAKEAFDARQFDVALSVAKIVEGVLRQAGAAAHLKQVRDFANEVRTEKLRVQRQSAAQAKEQATTGSPEELAAQRILARGALLVMTFDEPTLGREADRIVVRDLSGSGKRSVVHGAKLRPGLAGDALRFDGQHDYVDITQYALNLHDYTVSAWVRGKGTILGTGQNSEWPMYWHLYSGGLVHHIEPWRGGGREYDLATARDTLVSSEPLLADRWTHVAVCRAGTVLRLYIDGKVAAENTAYHTQPFVTHSNWGMFIGMIKTWGTASPSVGGDLPRTSRFEGLLDELAIFDRSLGEDEVDVLHQLGKQRLSLLTAPLHRGK